jgi:hypothetical protein
MVTVNEKFFLIFGQRFRNALVTRLLTDKISSHGQSHHAKTPGTPQTFSASLMRRYPEFSKKGKSTWPLAIIGAWGVLLLVLFTVGSSIPTMSWRRW